MTVRQRGRGEKKDDGGGGDKKGRSKQQQPSPLHVLPTLSSGGDL